jgi:hypothetical protein
MLGTGAPSAVGSKKDENDKNDKLFKINLFPNEGFQDKEGEKVGLKHIILYYLWVLIILYYTFYGF